MNCRTCGAELPEGANFCLSCGARVSHTVERRDTGAVRRQTTTAPPIVASGGERRQITVLFADLVGSSAMSEELDPEDLSEVVQQYQALCNREIDRYEGHVAQYLGDGVLVYFGYPNAHDDDPFRAVRTALGILDGLDALRTRIRLAFDVEINVRMGIHTGRVVVSEMGGGSGKTERLAMGHVPNIAARVEGEAKPGTVAISETTHRFIAGHFEVEELGTRQLKGFSDPVPLFRPVRDKKLQHRLDAIPEAQATPFVGRTSELAELDAAWDAAADHAHVISVRGPAGVGKSRLLREFRRRKVTDEVTLLEVFCSPYAKGSPLRAIADMLERRLGVSETDSDAERVAALKAWAAKHPELPPETFALVAGLYDIDAGEDANVLAIPATKIRQRTLEVIALWVQGLAKAGRLMLSIEDVHWADPTTLDLISMLRTGETPLCLFTTTRPHFDPPWRGETTTHLELARLDRACADQMVRRVAGKPLPVQLLGRMLDRADGVPLYIEELTRVVLESGKLVDKGDHFGVDGDVANIAIPTTLEATLMAHLDRLGAAKAYAQLAALIGREFRLDLLSAVAGVDEEEVKAEVDELVEGGTLLVKERGGHALYLFKHALIQDAAYNSLLKRTRRQFHERIVETLQQHFPEIAEHQPELLAQHHEGAGERGKSLSLWLQAGLKAAANAAASEAVHFLRRALSHVDTIEDETERDKTELIIQGTLSPQLMATLGWASSEVAAASGRASELALKLQDYQSLYAATWGLWTVYFLRGELPAALEAASGARMMAQQSGGDPMLTLTSEHAWGFTRYFMGGFADAVASADAGLAHFNMEMEQAISATFQFSSSVALRAFKTNSLWMQGRFLDARESETAWFGLAEELAHVPSIAFARSFRQYLHQARHDYDALLRDSGTLMSIAQEEGFLLWVTVARIFVAWAQGMREDVGLDVAISTMRDAIEDFKATESRVILVEVYGMLAELERRAARWDDALGTIATGLAMVEERAEGVFAPELHRIQAEVLHARGEASEAAFEAAWACAESQGAVALSLRTAVSAAQHTGDASWRERVADALSRVQADDAEVDVVAARTLLNSN